MLRVNSPEALQYELDIKENECALLRRSRDRLIRQLRELKQEHDMLSNQCVKRIQQQFSYFCEQFSELDKRINEQDERLKDYRALEQLLFS